MDKSKINSIAQWFKVTSTCIIIIGFIVIAFWLVHTFSETNITKIDSSLTTLTFICYAVGIVVIALLFRGAGEAIQLLEDIKNKIK